MRKKKKKQHWKNAFIVPKHSLDAKVLPLSVFDLSVGHGGTIQGQCPMLQHPHSGTCLRFRVFYRGTEREKSSVSTQGSNIHKNKQVGYMPNCFYFHNISNKITKHYADSTGQQLIHSYDTFLYILQSSSLSHLSFFNIAINIIPWTCNWGNMRIWYYYTHSEHGC